MHSIQLNAVDFELARRWFIVWQRIVRFALCTANTERTRHHERCHDEPCILHFYSFVSSFFLFSLSIQQWELIVLSKLKWNISSVTPLDFLEHLLVRLPISSQHTDISKIKKHAQAFISLAARGECCILYFYTHKWEIEPSNGTRIYMKQQFAIICRLNCLRRHNPHVNRLRRLILGFDVCRRSHYINSCAKAIHIKHHH